MNLDYLSLTLLGAALVLGGLLFIQVFAARPRLILVLFLVFILFQWIIVNQVGGKTSAPGLVATFLDEALILLLFSVSVLNAFAVRRRIPINYILIGLGAVIITGVAGALINKTPAVIVLSDILIYLKGFMVLAVFASLNYPEAFLRRLMKLFAPITSLVLFLALADFLNPAAFRSLIGNVVEIDWRVGFPSVQSVFIHPGLFGWYCAFAGLYAFALYLTRRKLKYAVFLSFCLLGVVASMRLKPVGAVAAALAAGLMFYSSRAKVAIVSGTLLLVLVFLAVFRLQIAGVVREQAAEYQNPMKPRTVFYRTSVELARKHFPLGVGFGRFGGEIAARHYSPVYREYGFPRMHGLWPEGRFLTDTFWPMVLGELGVIGLAFYLGICLWILIMLRRAYRVVKSPYCRAFVLGTVMVFIEGLVESLAEPVFVKPPAAYFIFAAAGISWSLMMNERGKVAPAAEEPRPGGEER